MMKQQRYATGVNVNVGWFGEVLVIRRLCSCSMCAEDGVRMWMGVRTLVLEAVLMKMLQRSMVKSMSAGHGRHRYGHD